MTLNFLIFIASVPAGFFLVFFSENSWNIIFIILLHCCHCAFYSVSTLHGFFSFSSAHSLCCCTVERDQILRMRNLLTNNAVPLLINQDQVLIGTVAAEGIRIISQLLNMWEAHCHRLQKERSWSLLISPGWYCCMSCSLDASKGNGWICYSWIKLNHVPWCCAF